MAATAGAFTGEPWLLTASALGFLAAPAAAVFYGKDAAKSLHLSLGITAVTAVMWGLISFSEVWGVPISTGVIGSDTFGTVQKIGTGNDAGKPYNAYTYVTFELAFALQALNLIAGAVGYRFKSAWFIAYALAALLVNYTPQAMWFWNPMGWARSYGMVDQAGGLVVHSTAGIAALALGLLAGHKEVASTVTEQTSLTTVFLSIVASAALYAGKAATTGTNTGLSLVNTIFAAAAGIFAYNFSEMVLSKDLKLFTAEYSLAGSAKGAMIGLASIAAGAGYIPPMWTILCALVTVLIVYFAEIATKNIKTPGLELFLTHGLGSYAGVALTGLFADDYFGPAKGSFYYHAALLGKQCAGISTIILMTTVTTVLLFGALWVAARVIFQANITVEEAPAAVAEPTAKAEPVVSA